MLIVTYDISDDKIRTRFSNFLKKFGHRVQYSVFQIKNSRRILDNIVAEIEARYEKEFHKCDSVIIFRTCKACDENVIKFGYAENDDCDIIFM